MKKKKGYLILTNFMLNVFYSFFEVGIKNIGYDYYWLTIHKPLNT